MKIYIWLKNFKCQSCNCLSLKWRLVQKFNVMRTRSNVLLATLKGKQKMSAVACCNIHVLLVTLEGKQKMPAMDCCNIHVLEYSAVQPVWCWTENVWKAMTLIVLKLQWTIKTKQKNASSFSKNCCVPLTFCGVLHRSTLSTIKELRCLTLSRRPSREDSSSSEDLSPSSKNSCW